MILLVLVVSFLAGFYPRYDRVRFQPGTGDKNKISAANTGALGLRRALVVIQFGDHICTDCRNSGRDQSDDLYAGEVIGL